jgi:hypothetical protein
LHAAGFVAAVIGGEAGRAEVVAVDVVYLVIDAGGNSAGRVGGEIVMFGREK